MLGFEEARVNPLTADGRAELVRSWHRAVAGQLSDPTQDEVRSLEDTGERLILQLAESPRIARLATNPLLCAMVCALHLERHEHLPKSARDLCNAACEMLLHRRELESGIDTGRFSAGYSSLEYEQKRGIVQNVAHYMVRNEASAIDRAEALRQVTGSLSAFPTVLDPDPDEVLDGLLERSGVLREDKPGSIEFVHNTIKEYLAAERYVHDRDAGALASKFNDPSFEPVLLFACAERDPTFATRMLRAVLDATTDGDRHERQVFAVRARAVALHLDPALSQEVERFEQTLFPPRSMSDAEALAELGESVIPYLRYQPATRSRAAAACVRALRLIGTEAAFEAIRSFIANRTRAVRTELLRALDPLEVPWFHERFIGTASPPRPLRPSEIREYHRARRRVKNLRLIDRTALAGVEDLDLSSTSVRDLSPLRHARSLRHLSLAHTRPRSLAPLDALGSLEVLDVSYCRAVDVAPLGRLPHLRALNVEGSGFDLAPLWAEGEFENLETLVGSGSPIPTEGSAPPLVHLATVVQTRDEWEALGRLHYLRTLYVVGSVVQLGDLSALASAGAGSLQSLTVSDSEIEPGALAFDCPSLQRLSLGGSSLQDDVAFGNLTDLRVLDLSHTQTATTQAVGGLHRLEAIDLRGCPVADYSYLVALPHLMEVGAGTDTAAFVEALPNLHLDGIIVLGPTRGAEYKETASALREHGFVPHERGHVFGTVEKMFGGPDPFGDLGWYVSLGWGARRHYGLPF